MSDLARSFVSELGKAAESTDLKFHQGLVLAWNAATGQNTIRVAGSDIADVPVLTSAGLVALRPGDPVAVFKYKSAYFIFGRIVGVDSGLVQPQWPIVLYPMFNANGTPGSTGYARVNGGVLATWEGRIKVSHPKIEVDGVWGNASGTGSSTYALKIDNTTVGQWTVTGLVVDHASVLAGLSTGGFDVSAFLGRDWLKVEVAITTNGSTGELAFQPLGVFFRQT